MKALIPCLLIALLAACSPLTIPGESISVPAPEKADAPPAAAFAGKIRVGNVTADGLVYGAFEQRELAFEKPQLPLENILASAGYLAKDTASALYVLDAKVTEIVNAVCMFGDCITHATVRYTLTPEKTDKPLWQRRLKTAFHYAHGTFSMMDDATHRTLIGGALTRNFQEAVRLLAEAETLEKPAKKPKPVSLQKTP